MDIGDFFFIVCMVIFVLLGVSIGTNRPHSLDEGIYVDEIEYDNGTYNYDTNVGINFISTTKYSIGDKVMIVKQTRK